MSGTVVGGPFIDKQHHPVVCFKHGKVLFGDYSVFTTQNNETDYLAAGEKEVKCFTIHRRPFLEIIDTFYPDERTRLSEMVFKKVRSIK